MGKTRLVASVADRSRAAGHTVLWARCLRFGAESSPYLPFISAFEGLRAEGHTVEGVDLAPLYGGNGDGDGVHGDCNATFPVGEITADAEALLEAGKRPVNHPVCSNR